MMREWKYHHCLTEYKNAEFVVIFTEIVLPHMKTLKKISLNTNWAPLQ